MELQGILDRLSAAENRKLALLQSDGAMLQAEVDSTHQLPTYSVILFSTNMMSRYQTFFCSIDFYRISERFRLTRLRSSLPMS